MNAIIIQSVKKTYGAVEALTGVDLTLREGEFFGLLGPNGAGKTTLIHSIMGLVKPDSGSITILGQPGGPQYFGARRFLGFSPQEVNVDRFFNIRRTLEFQAGFYGYPRSFSKKRAGEMLEQFKLTSKANQPFYKLSGGMQRRLLIARALMNKPKILILDEPSAGIDVEQRRELWEYLRGLNRDGTTILLTTHYIDEAQALCERVAIIDEGRIIEQGRPLDLIEKYCDQGVEITLSLPPEPRLLADLPDVVVEHSTIRGKGNKMGPLTAQILQRVMGLPSVQILDIRVRHGSLEEVFILLTGQPLGHDERQGNQKSGFLNYGNEAIPRIFNSH